MKQRWFLSYNSQDVPLMQSFQAALAQKDPGAHIFFAPRSLRAGGFWLPELANEIAEATAFVLLVGKAGVGPWQTLEYYEALERRVKSPHFPIILLLLDGQPAPGLPFLRRLHWIVTQDPAAERSVAQVLDAVGGGVGQPGELWRHTAPYRGLSAMIESDADFFFGRGRETVEVIASLTSAPDGLPVLLGNSGVGKSSVAQAGVLAALMRQAWPDSIAAGTPWPRALDETRRWCFLRLKPGGEPVRALVEPFLKTWQFDPVDPDRAKLQSRWVANLLDGSVGLRDLLDATEERCRKELHQPPPPAFLLYVDQGEELYVRAEEGQRRRFSEILAVGITDPRLRAMMSMRSDFLGELQQDEPLYAVHQQINVPPLRETELREVVSRPAALLSARFETESLPTDIARRTADESTKDAGVLPLLSYLLDDMWTRMVARGDGVLRLPAQAIELGQVLVERADAFLAGHPRVEDQLRRILILKLAMVREDGEPTRRRASRSEFQDEEWRLVSELADHPNRLLVTASTDAGETYAEVAHEAIFRRWDKLRDWIAAEREFLVWRGRLEAERRRWQGAPEDSRNDALLMGLALAQAQNWLAARQEDIPADDRTFIDLSVRREALEREQKQRLRRRLQRGALAALVVMTVLAAIATVGFYRAEAAAQIATRIQAKYDVLKAAIAGTEQKLRLPAYAHLTPAAVIADLENTYGVLDAESFDALLRLGVHAKRIVWLDPAPLNNVNEAAALQKMGFETVQVTTIDDAAREIGRVKADLIITHFGNNPGGKTQSNAYRLRAGIGTAAARIPMIIYSVSVTEAYACDAQRDGFYDELDKPTQLLQSAVRSVQGQPPPSRCRS